MTTQTAPRQAPARRSRKYKTPIVIGAILVLARIIVPAVSGMVFKASVNTVENVCHSGLGSFAVVSNRQVAASCNEADTVMLVLNLAALAGLALIAWGGFLLYKSAHRRDIWTPRA